MSDHLCSSTSRAKNRRLGEVASSLGGSYYFRSQSPFLSFKDRLRISRGLFSDASQTAAEQTRRHHNQEAAIGYQHLRVRGFLVQGYLDPKNPSLDDAFRIIDSIGWSYTVMHVNPVCPNVVREFVSNKPFNKDNALIRGHLFRFTPSVINQLMMTPSVTHSFAWRSVDLKQAITYLTGHQCLGWKGFNFNALRKPFQTLHRVCELNWIPGPYSDTMMQNRLHLLYAVAKRKQLSLCDLVYDQVIEMARTTGWDTDLIFPNLIYDVLVLQKDVPVLPVDEEHIGKGLPIYGHEGDTSGPRGSRRLY